MIPLASVDKIVRKAGVNRISAQAIKDMQKIIEEIGYELSLEAAQVARHAKRKTVLKEDIKFVAGKC